ncbi:hypothetical protein AWB80_04814 [Caballeronia pedi]|uniref:Uncharacterized protein n=1 Tax=Caballeronia pedi TaxID=1777141 RepID=A0A158C8U6_9BURK|nr:hypothetical protein AWB80_04814 [Caballeronia pedi]
MLAQRARIDLRSQRDISDQLLIILLTRPRDDHRFAHFRMTGDLRLDLTQFDTKATNLDLMIVAAKKLETAIRTITPEITRTIHPRTRSKRIVDEPLGGKLRPIQISPRHARTADIQFTHRTDRRQFPLCIEQINREIRNTHTDRAIAVRAIFACQRAIGHVHGRLGDAVHVDQARLLVRMTRVPGFEHRRIQRLSAEDHIAQRSRSIVSFLRLNEGAKRAGRLIQNSDPLALKQAKEIRREPGDMLRHDHQLAAMTQRAPQLPHRKIEGERVEQTPHIAFMKAEPVLRRVEQAHDLRMLDHHALGFAGRPGRVDHVRKMRRSDGHLRIVLRI